MPRGVLACFAYRGRVHAQNPERSLGDDVSKPLTTRETAQLAGLFCFLWFIANWTVNASLDYTSVASATILSSMSGEYI